MIVEWKKDNLKGIPAGGELVVLMGGYNEVAPKLWKVAREAVQDELKRGEIVEVEPEMKDGKLVGAASFVKLEASKALEIVAGTYSLQTLELWRSVSVKDEIRTAILNRIEAVEREAKGQRI